MVDDSWVRRIQILGATLAICECASLVLPTSHAESQPHEQTDQVSLFDLYRRYRIDRTQSRPYNERFLLAHQQRLENDLRELREAKEKQQGWIKDANDRKIQEKYRELKSRSWKSRSEVTEGLGAFRSRYPFFGVSKAFVQNTNLLPWQVNTILRHPCVDLLTKALIEE